MASAFPSLRIRSKTAVPLRTKLSAPPGTSLAARLASGPCPLTKPSSPAGSSSAPSANNEACVPPSWFVDSTMVSRCETPESLGLVDRVVGLAAACVLVLTPLRCLVGAAYAACAVAHKWVMVGTLVTVDDDDDDDDALVPATSWATRSIATACWLAQFR